MKKLLNIVTIAGSLALITLFAAQTNHNLSSASDSNSVLTTEITAKAAKNVTLSEHVKTLLNYRTLTVTEMIDLYHLENDMGFDPFKMDQMLQNGFPTEKDYDDYLESRTFTMSQALSTKDTTTLGFSEGFSRYTSSLYFMYNMTWKVTKPNVTTVAERDDAIRDLSSKIGTLAASKSDTELKNKNAVKNLQAEFNTLARNTSNEKITLTTSIVKSSYDFRIR